MSVRSTKDPKAQEYDLADILGVKPRRLIGLLLKKLGDEVAKGDLIAKKGGIKRRFFVSPIAGKIVSLSEKGRLKILPEINPSKARSSKDEAKEEEGGKKDLPVGKGYGGKGRGSLVFFESEVSVFDVGADLEDKVIAFPGRLSFGLWYKCLSLGVKGLICSQLPEEDFEKKIKKNFTEKAEGEKDEEVPLLVIEPAGEGWTTLKEYQGQLVEIDGSAQTVVLVEEEAK